MCLAIPGQIASLMDADNAIVNIGGIEKMVSIALIENPQVNDWVIVHVGFALNKIDADEAERTLAALRAAGELTDADVEEVAPNA